MTPSPNQKEIFNFIRNSNESLMINAVAGSGKTTTIVAAAKMIPVDKKVIFCAFNKSIATELGRRLPKNVVARTLNAVGHAAWCASAGSVRLDKSKTYNILKSIEVQSNKLLIFKNIRAILKLVGLAKQMGIVPEGAPKCTNAISITSLSALMISHDVIINPTKDRKTLTKDEYDKHIKFTTDEVKTIVMDVLKKSIRIRGTIDFDDQLYMPIIYGSTFKKYDVIFLDESQDISEIQREMISRSMRPDSRIIAVGDRNQAIYGFRGADSKSLDEIISKFKCKELSLSVSYRCAKNIVDVAQKYNRGILARDGAPDGIVKKLKTYDVEYRNIKADDIVLCRNISPLIKMLFFLKENGTESYMLGVDIRDNMVTLINRLGAYNTTILREKLDEWVKYELHKLKLVHPKASGATIKARAKDITTVLDSIHDVVPVVELVSIINSMFCATPVPGVLLLSTIHKAKGLESDVVWILDRHLMPSKHATTKWMVEQEKNLIYVAVTRAINELYYIATPE